MLRSQYFSGALANDDAASLDFAGDYARHYRSVCDAKTVDSLNSEPAIYHCHGIASRFLERVGTTPAEWVVTSRVRRAQQFLETTRFIC